MSLIIALALPLDKANVCFLFVTIMFSFLTLSTIFGMSLFMA